MTARTTFTIAAAVLAGTVASTSFAATINVFDSTTAALPTSNTDLINGRAPTTISGFQDFEGIGSDTSGVALTNGLPSNPGKNAPDISIATNGAVVTYTLPANAGGYTITDVNTFSAWNDSGRINQDYTVSFALQGSPNTFGNAITVAADANGGGNSLTREVAISGIGLSNVVGVQFSFPATENGYVGYRELDVIGTATSAPEPASLGLLGVGAVGLLSRRRRV